MTTWERLKYEILLPVPVIVILALLVVFSFTKFFLHWPTSSNHVELGPDDQ